MRLCPVGQELQTSYKMWVEDARAALYGESVCEAVHKADDGEAQCDRRANHPGLHRQLVHKGQDAAELTWPNPGRQVS